MSMGGEESSVLDSDPARKSKRFFLFTFVLIKQPGLLVVIAHSVLGRFAAR